MGTYRTELDSPHARRPAEAPHGRFNLERLATQAAALLPGCDCDLILGCDGDLMLMVAPTSAYVDDPTWIATIISATSFRLEAMADNARFVLLAEAPPRRILAHLANLACHADLARHESSARVRSITEPTGA